MATTIRPSSSGREKRGTSPSTSLTKKSPKPSPSSSSSSSSHANGKNLSPIDKKPVSSLLKPTTTKRLSIDSSQKPISRRRSFDRPPPASLVNKAIHSSPATHEVKHTRSSSFSHKPITSSPLSASTRPISTRTYARTSSTPKTSESSDLSKSRLVKRTTTSLSPSIGRTSRKDIKNGNGVTSAKKGPKSVTSESGIEHVYDDDIPCIHQLGYNIEVQSLPEISEMPDLDEELGDPTIIEIDIKAKYVMDLQDNVALNVEQEEIEQETVEKRQEMLHNVEESIAEEQNQTAEEQNILIAGSDEGVQEELYAEDEKLSDSSAAVSKPEPVRAQIVAGKKEKQDYNDVIEETANKLMGGRKNKVLALARAFETVISLQETRKI